MNDPVLCYVDGGVLYFTTQPLAEQWGDDWDDAPYDCNAGLPSTPCDGEAWEIIEVRYSGDFETPATYAYNSPWSVEQINQRRVPWLQTDRLSPYTGVVQLWAGMTLAEVVRGILEGGGMVYAPIDGSLAAWLPIAA